MQYMIVFDGWDRPLIDETITNKVERLRQDGGAVNHRLADRLEALRMVEIPPPTPQDVDQASEAVRRSREETMPLMAQIIHASTSQTAATQQAVIDGLQRDVGRLEACLHLIRSGIEELYSHPWNPRSFQVLGALYPDRDAIEQTAANLAMLDGR